MKQKIYDNWWSAANQYNTNSRTKIKRYKDQRRWNSPLKITFKQIDTILDIITITMLLIIGGIETNPGPSQNTKKQLQIITQNTRGLMEKNKEEIS